MERSCANQKTLHQCSLVIWAARRTTTSPSWLRKRLTDSRHCSEAQRSFSCSSVIYSVPDSALELEVCQRAAERPRHVDAQRRHIDSSPLSSRALHERHRHFVRKIGTPLGHDRSTHLCVALRDLRASRQDLGTQETPGRLPEDDDLSTMRFNDTVLRASSSTCEL